MRILIYLNILKEKNILLLWKVLIYKFNSYMDKIIKLC